ncbi:hypothetical protein L6164_030224 [Bauhinia variegata]|uniref:Uncharacterized protein n=1 Tax=Bauhinia variegata TaxID=167791 RepID=A0ACB9LBR7_BAUVA|nr:hypothetical protein L6164_030224 [Bauhinia variegata]
MWWHIVECSVRNHMDGLQGPQCQYMTHDSLTRGRTVHTLELRLCFCILKISNRSHSLREEIQISAGRLKFLIFRAGLVEMDDGIDASIPLDYAAIEIFPNQNRYEAFVYRKKQSERVTNGLLEHLLPHLPGINDLYAKGFDANFDLKLPENLHDVDWFSKGTVARFLHVVGSPDLINAIDAIMDEMFQLEESKKFHVSLYGKGHEDHLENGAIGSSGSTGVAPASKPEVNNTSSNASKNELLRAMDLRLTALSKELAANFSTAAGSRCSPRDMTHLAKFCQYFGATNMEHSLCKIMELSQKIQDVGPMNNETTVFTCAVVNNDAKGAIKDPQLSKPVHLVTPVRYGVSPAKAAQVERESSTDGEQSSHSSDEGQTSAERSRTLVRSATPRRSASPMRRVQIGRAGPRRATALTIKSLGYLPTRERPTSYRDMDANGYEEEASEKPYKKPDIDVRRITVQDAISLFESKQREQSTDIQKRRSLVDVSSSTNKSVLRRWSAGMGETSVKSHPEIVSGDPVPVTSNDVADGEIPKSSEMEMVSDFVTENHNSEITESDIKPEGHEGASASTVDNQAEPSLNLGEEIVKKLTSAEWNKQKQAEFNQIFMKMMEGKSNRNQNLASKQRGGSYDHYKEKRDAKLRGENAGKRVEKEAQFQAMQQILDKRKNEMASKNVSTSKMNPTRKPQKSPRNSSQPANSLKEISKPSVTKKLTSKTSPLPATRKSWTATPSPRPAATSPAKILNGVSSAGSTPVRRKPQPLASVPQPSSQKEKPQQRNRNERETKAENLRNSKSMNEKRKPSVTNKSKETKAKVTTASGETPASKISLNKGTKKSSVVPLESKPFLRKGSGVGRGAGNPSKKKNSAQLEESLIKSANSIEDQESGLAVNTSDLVTQHSDGDIVTPTHQNATTEGESQISTQLQGDETENLEQSNIEGDVYTIIAESPLKIMTEEVPTISPSAWVEIEEHLEQPKPCEDGIFQPASPTNNVPGSPRVRHSLSQMLQEESSEPDTNEWGNAEHPPSMIYQKDAPKGLKRLLKFARKSKGDANSTGWSSPSVFSEGEDDAEESKNSSKKNADNLLRKAALHAKSYGQPKSSLDEGYERNSAESNLRKIDSKSSHKIQEGGPSTKGSRSFFSLSAFRGSKEGKFH